MDEFAYSVLFAFYVLFICLDAYVEWKFAPFLTMGFTSQNNLMCGSPPSEGEMQWYSWLRHCATKWKIAGSIPDVVIGIFH